MTGMTPACALCGQPLSETCCLEVEQRKEEYRREQEYHASLLDDLGIQVVRNPSRVIKDEWEAEPELGSLWRFLEGMR